MPITLSEEGLQAIQGAKGAINSRINEIREACGIEIKDAVVEWSHLEVTLKPLVTLELHRLNRLDLALEHIVLDPVWAPAFWTDLRKQAKRNLTTVMQFAELERELKSTGQAQSKVDISQDKLVVIGNRIFWIWENVNAPSDLNDHCARSERLELELMSEAVLPYSIEHHKHVLFCTRCRSRSPVVFEILERLVELDLKLFTARLQVLAVTQDVAESRVDELLFSMPDLERDRHHAAEILGYRALIAANFLDYEVLLSHLVPEDTELHPLCALEKGHGHSRAVDLLRSIDPDLLKSGYAATLLSQIWFNDPFVVLEDFRIPTAGDLVPFAWAVPVEVTAELQRWKALLLYERTGSLEVRKLIETVRLAAATAFQSGPVSLDATSAADDLLQNTHDMVWMSAQKIDEVARRLNPSEDEIRHRLCDLLGVEVFERLSSHSRQSLLDAERIFADGHITPHLSIWAIGVAFELEVMESILPHLKDLLRERGKLYSLDNIEKALLRECPDSIRHRFSRVGLDALQVGRAIERLRPIYNNCKHRKVNLLREDVRKVRENWYGLVPGVLGVFHAITGSSHKSTGTAIG